MSALDKGYHLPVAFNLFATFLTYMVLRDLRTGEVWRGGGHEATITRAKDAGEFYFTIAGLSALALTFWAGTLWMLFLMFRRRPKWEMRNERQRPTNRML
jgi:hypothetical protein